MATASRLRADMTQAHVMLTDGTAVGTGMLP